MSNRSNLSKAILSVLNDPNIFPDLYGYTSKEITDIFLQYLRICHPNIWGAILEELNDGQQNYTYVKDIPFDDMYHRVRNVLRGYLTATENNSTDPFYCRKLHYIEAERGLEKFDYLLESPRPYTYFFSE